MSIRVYKVFMKCFMRHGQWTVWFEVWRCKVFREICLVKASGKKTVSFLECRHLTREPLNFRRSSASRTSTKNRSKNYHWYALQTHSVNIKSMLEWLTSSLIITPCKNCTMMAVEFQHPHTTSGSDAQNSRSQRCPLAFPDHQPTRIQPHGHLF